MKDSRGCSFLICCLLFALPSLTHATPEFIQAAQEGRLDSLKELLNNPQENINGRNEEQKNCSDRSC